MLAFSSVQALHILTRGRLHAPNNPNPNPESHIALPHTTTQNLTKPYPFLALPPQTDTQATTVPSSTTSDIYFSARTPVSALWSLLRYDPPRLLGGRAIGMIRSYKGTEMGAGELANPISAHITLSYFQNIPITMPSFTTK